MNWSGFGLLATYVEDRITEFNLIPPDRIGALEILATQIRQKIQTHKRAQLIYICTHNSRRSHFGHLWAQLAASYYQVEGINCFSGGTEVTAFNPRAVKALVDSGMQISRQDENSNPIYRVKFSSSVDAIDTFSKRYFDPPNPTEDFIAVMTCSDADEACPVVHGASSRIAITYEDPKESDDTINETAIYSQRCQQIAQEMFYLFSMI